MNYTLRDAAEQVSSEARYAIGADDLNYWQNVGLLGRPLRACDVERATQIGVLRKAGFSLQSIRGVWIGGEMSGQKVLIAASEIDLPRTATAQDARAKILALVRSERQRLKDQRFETAAQRDRERRADAERERRFVEQSEQIAAMNPDRTIEAEKPVNAMEELDARIDEVIAEYGKRYRSELTRGEAARVAYQKDPTLFERVQVARREEQSAPREPILGPVAQPSDGPVATEVRRKVDVLVAEDPALNRAEATKRVYEAEPKLFLAWQAERRGDGH